MLTPVLITSAIKPPADLPYLAMSDFNHRLIAIKAALFYWIAQGTKKIVVVDSTGTSPINAADSAVIDSLGVELEILTFLQNDDEIRQFGKGYGEGKIISYALNHSSIIGRSDFLYKCTGKCFCRNFRLLDGIIKGNNLKAVFWRLFDRNFVGPDLSLVDTRFFFTSKDFLKSFVLPAFESAKNISVERTLAPVLTSELEQAYIARSQITGFAGGVGGEYAQIDLGHLESSFPSWIMRATTSV